MNKITATSVGYPFLFMLIAVTSFDFSSKIAMGILLFAVTIIAALIARLRELKINAILSGMLAAAFACMMFAAIEYREQSGYADGVKYPTHLVGRVVEEPYHNGRYQYIIKTDDGKRILFYSDALDNGEIYSRFEGDVVLYLRDSVKDGASFCAYSDNEDNCSFTKDEFGIHALLTYAKNWSCKRLDEVSDSESAEFLKGVMLGEDGKISSSLRRAFKATGLTHILVVSGSHLTTVLMAITAAFTFSRQSRRYYYIIALCFMFAYMALVGFGPSVVRSGISSIVLGLSYITARDSNPVNSLGAAALITGVIDPYTAVSVGFQLSFFSTFGIVTVGLMASRKISQSNIPKALKSVSKMFIITFTAQAFIMPVLIPIYSELSVLSVMSNMLVGVAVDIAVVSCLIYLVLSATFILYPLAIPFGFVSNLLAKYCVRVANSLSSQDLAYIKIPQMVFAVLITVVFCAFSILLICGRRYIKAFVVTLSICLLLSVGATVYYNNSIRITAAANGAYIITYKGNSVIAGCGENFYDAKLLLYSQSQLINSDVSLVVGEDNKSNALISVVEGTNPDIVMSPLTARLSRYYGDRLKLFKSGSITPFEGCKVTDTDDYIIVNIAGVTVTVSKKGGAVPPELETDILICADSISGYADTAIIMHNTKPLALSANKVYNTSSESFELVVSKSGRIISVE